MAIEKAFYEATDWLAENASFGSIIDNLVKFEAEINVKTDLKQQLEPLILLLADKIQVLLKDIGFAAKEFLHQGQEMAQQLIAQVLTGFSQLAIEVSKLAQKLVDSAFEQIDELRQNLVANLENIIKRVDKFRQDLIADVITIINEFKGALKEILVEGDKILTGTVTELSDELRRYYLEWENSLVSNLLNVLNPDRNREAQRHKACKQELNIQEVPLPLIGPGKLFDYLECRELKRLDENVTIKNIKTVYADLHNRAWKLACVGRAEGSALQEKATKAWLKYGQLYYLWNDFEDETMTALQAIEQKMQQLNNQIANFEAKFAKYESLVTTLSKVMAEHDLLNAEVKKAQEIAETAQGTAERAKTKADGAQGTANQAVGLANAPPQKALEKIKKEIVQTVENTANQGVNLANQALGERNISLGWGNLLGCSLGIPGETFVYSNRTMGHYSLTWGMDSWERNGPTAWFAGWGGIKLFTGGGERFSITAGGQIRYTVSLDKSSSRELKENIVDFSAEDAAEIMEGLTPVSYILKNDEDKRLHIGFIAEDVPEPVASFDRKAISNDNIVAVLTKVVKEQQKTIAELQKDIQSLKT